MARKEQVTINGRTFEAEVLPFRVVHDDGWLEIEAADGSRHTVKQVVTGVFREATAPGEPPRYTLGFQWTVSVAVEPRERPALRIVPPTEPAPTDDGTVP